VAQWWRGGAIYQIYVRSFMDSDGDGVGDLAGITERLDYLSWLGMDGVWLSPTMPSPNEDWGYDVSDYLGVDPSLGTMRDLEILIVKARERGIAVVLDLVPNHTSIEHPWFQAALHGREDPHRDFYVWAPPGPGGGPPNNWLAADGQPAWTLDPSSGQYYLHQFLPAQPDLNWWNPDVRDRFDDILRWWFDHGVAGFRIDVAHGLVKDASLRDDPPAAPDDHPMAGRHGLRRAYSANRPEVHDIYRRWRRIADSYDPPRVLLGETWVFEPRQLGSFYGEGDELHLAFNFSFLFADFSVPCLSRVVRDTLAALPNGACPVWTGSNHDVSRLLNRWCAGNRRRAGAALVLLCTLPGTVVLYYGDEIGMADVDVPTAEARDRMGLGDPAGQPPRDRARTPMQWEAGPGCGFTSAARPWLPLGDCRHVSVAGQREDPWSLLSITRRLLSLRREGFFPAMGRYEEVVAGDQLWVYRVGEATVMANLSEEPASVHLPGGPMLASTGPAVLEDGVLEPWGAVVVGQPS
jgi:alpha-glucosidase